MPDSRGVARRSAAGRRLHLFALFTVAVTALLLLMGGLVTSKGAGLAVPDWPTTFGYGMFSYPWALMVGDVFYEHSHRLIGSFVGLLTLGLATWLWLRDSRPWVKALAVAAVLLVVAQGIMGGLRVVFLAPSFALVHGFVAHAFFALIVSLAVFTSEEWTSEPTRSRVNGAPRLKRLAIATTVLIYLQAVAGAFVRHTGKGVEAHVVLAVVVLLHVGLLVVRCRRLDGGELGLAPLAWTIAGLAVFQTGLGLAAYAARFTEMGAAFSISAAVAVRTGHVLAGALLLAGALTLALRACRRLDLPAAASGESVFTAARAPRAERAST
jgi:cytochrome c oxidase assembly protein subunit 15